MIQARLHLVSEYGVDTDEFSYRLYWSEQAARDAVKYGRAGRRYVGAVVTQDGTNPPHFPVFCD